MVWVWNAVSVGLNRMLLGRIDHNPPSRDSCTNPIAQVRYFFFRVSDPSAMADIAFYLAGIDFGVIVDSTLWPTRGVNADQQLNLTISPSKTLI